MPNYPSSVRTFLQKVNLVDIVYASDYNELAGEISAIELALGVNVATAGTRTPTALSLVARLAAIDAALGVVESRFDGTGLVPQAGVNGLVSTLNDLRAMLDGTTGNTAFASLTTAVQSRALITDLDIERASRIAQGTTLSNADSAETSARMAADNVLTVQGTTLSNANLSEIAARTAADNSLQLAINNTRIGSSWTDIPDSASKVDPFYGNLQVQVRGGVAFMRGGGQPLGSSTAFPLNVNNLVGTLPAFARPQQTKLYSLACSSHLGHVVVSSTGALWCFFTSATGWFTLDTVSFSDVVSTSPYAF